MLKQNKIFSLSERFNKYENIKNNLRTNEAFIYLKSKRTTHSDFYNKGNRSIDFLAKTTNLFDLGKLKEKGNQNLKNQLNIINSMNYNEKLNQKLYQNFFNNNKKEKIRRIILSKKKILETILDEERKNSLKEKIINNIDNKNNENKKINSKSKKNKGVIVINNVSMPEIEMNKKNNFKIKNIIDENDIIHSNTFNLKNIDNYNKNILQEKLYQIKMNKIALFRKIKFAGLKKYCNKDLKFNSYNKKFGINYISEQNIQNKDIQNFNRNELRNNLIKNNCNEITINSLRESVRNYFIGKFHNIKEYFDDWDEQGQGKININDIYKYLNNKIKFRISKEEIQKFIRFYNNKNYFNLENFKYFFFEEPSNEKLSIQKENYLKSEYKMNKSSSEGILFIDKNKKDNNLYYCDKNKYSELINLIKEQNDNKLIKVILNNKNEDELNYNDFYNLIDSFIPKNKKKYFEKEIKRIFNNHKIKKEEKVNIKDFFEKINNKKEEFKLFNNNSNNTFSIIKKEINQGYTTFYEKKMNNKKFNDNRNQDNILIKKNINFSKTNNIFYKKKDFEETKINKKDKLINLTKEYKSQDIKEEKIKKPIKYFTFNAIKGKSIKNNFSMTQENFGKKTLNIKYYPSFRKFQLPIITKYSREQNKNSDIINLL